MEHIKSVRLEQGGCISSYDVKVLFTSVPVYPAISTIKHKLQQDPKLHSRTSMSLQHVTTLLEFCLKIPASSSKVSIMNRGMVQLWVPLSVPLWPTCSWRSLSPRPSALPPLHPDFA